MSIPEKDTIIIFTDDDTLTEEEKEELFNGAEEQG